MQLKFLICGESAAVDNRRNSLSIFHMLDEINAAAFPVVVAQMCIAMLFERNANDAPEPNNVSLQISLNDQELFRTQIDLRFGAHYRMRYVTDFRGLLVSAPGNLRFAVTVGEERLGEWVVPVNHIGQLMVQPDLPLRNQPANAENAGGD